MFDYSNIAQTSRKMLFGALARRNNTAKSARAGAPLIDLCQAWRPRRRIGELSRPATVFSKQRYFQMSASAASGNRQDGMARHRTRRPLGLVAGVVACAALAGATGCATSSKVPAPSLAEVVQMSNDGLADDQIIMRLHESKAVYPLSASGILDLDRQGVSTPVLDYMQQAYVDSERRRERLTYGDPYWRGHYWGYPCFGCPYPYYGIAPFYIYAY
jgi:hypothetical protein